MCRSDYMHHEKVPTNAFARHPICSQRSLTGLLEEKGVASRRGIESMYTEAHLNAHIFYVFNKVCKIQSLSIHTVLKKEIIVINNEELNSEMEGLIWG